MKSAIFKEYGEPEVIKIEEIDKPVVGRNQVLVKVKAAGVNPADWKTIAGFFSSVAPTKFPSGIGVEAAGVVNAVGEDVINIREGDAVFGLGLNTMAEYALLNYWVKKPKALSFEEASGISVAAETAVRALSIVGAEPGETLLIHGASGGVGTLATMIALHRGIKVIGTARSKSNMEYIKSIGAIAVESNSALVENIKRESPKIDTALDFVGLNIPELIEIVGDSSRVGTIVDIEAPQQYGVQGLFSGQSNPIKALEEIVELYNEREFKLNIDNTFKLNEISDAYNLSKKGRTKGKIVVRPIIGTC